MNQHTNPLDYLIECCETAINTGKWNLNKFTIFNAKDELKKLRQLKQDMTQDAFEANKNSCEDTERWLSCEKELYDLKNKIKTIFSKPIAYGLINDRHDLYALNLQNNSHNDQSKVIPLYSDKSEFLSDDWKGYIHSDKFLN